MGQMMIALADLAGGWRLSRQIFDHRCARQGRFAGECHWRPDAIGYRQDEAGILSLGDAPPMQAHRRYLWRADGAGLAVFFADGRPFHRIAPGQLSDRHHCAPDCYDVTYDFSRWPDWTQSWRVQGPRKDMTIHSRFQRLG